MLIVHGDAWASRVLQLNVPKHGKIYSVLSKTVRFFNIFTCFYEQKVSKYALNLYLVPDDKYTKNTRIPYWPQIRPDYYAWYVAHRARVQAGNFSGEVLLASETQCQFLVASMVKNSWVREPWPSPDNGFLRLCQRTERVIKYHEFWQVFIQSVCA